MYLKKLELNGFKSFADKTTLQILPGITSIVGPNGCGKTNIVDAISWVLGEQRVRILRGYKMEDIIFNGTSGRPPVGMAEVNLIFDNSDGKLPIEYSEVSISRRIYRSGESEYFLNKKPCRLKDINELLLGTGLGTRSYSLVGQGRVDQILQARPEERRELLEEAARISRYRKKKEEALRKLELTRTNLLRVDDILKEVQRQLSIAERQARQAEKYSRHRDRLRELETQSGLLQLAEIRRRAGELGDEKQRWEGKYRDLEKEVEEVEKELFKLRDHRRKRGEELSSLRAELIGKRAEIDKDRHRIELNAERGGELKHERERVGEEISDIKSSLSAGKKEAEELRKAREVLIRDNRAGAEALREKEQGLKSLRLDRSAVEKELAAVQSRSLEIFRREGHLRNELLGLQVGGKGIILRKRRLEVELEGIEAEEDELRAEIEKAGPRVEEAEENLSGLKEKLAGERERARKMEEQVWALQRRKEEMLVKISERESQKTLLRNRAEEGPGSAAEILISAAREKAEGLEGVIGRLEDFIEIRPGSEKMVRSALGENGQAVVVRGASAALAAIEYLKAKKAGPIRLIVHEWLQETAASRPNRAEGPDGTGIVDQATFLEPLQGAGQVLLEEAFPVSDLTRYLNRGVPTLPGTGITSEGATVSPPGIIFWAGEEAPSSRLEPGEIETELSRLRAERSVLETEEEEADNLLKKSREQVELALRDLHQQELDHALSRNEQERSLKNLQKLTLNLAGARDELNSLLEEEQKATGRLKQLEKNLADSPIGDQDKENEIARIRERLNERVHALRRLETEVTELKIALASSREREEGFSGRYDRLLSENRNQEALLEARHRRISEDEGREESLREETERLREEIEKWERTVDDLQARVGVMEEEIGQLDRSYEEKEEVYHKVRPRFQEVQAHLGSQDVTLAELRVKEQSICQRMREKYGLELDELEPSSQEQAPEALDAEIDRLREKMGRMTDVNLAALSDKENYESRFSLLTEQKEDLENAARDIEVAITRINITAREKLQETYDVVRLHFQDLFSQLFGGGKADLVLDNEKDILESGLDIIAQPPGKKLSHIALLSGGERALTTIALIFALFKVQPSPFYILDEIDAPLDEANIGRFVELVKKLVAEAQFIIITHNKLSISQADILYGITMEESGVSKVVSVRLASGERDKKKAKAS
ncbi:MAG: chromosome segregation protein SMC [Candidatus Euphemobacter frigidus]|nr:chromosome segregation protein SMC [Candidatus Euphemobacter frigidus]MDP8275098.1 chromosome segregation protein SMC [Candidatus Euphemobacter frigidus]